MRKSFKTILLSLILLFAMLVGACSSGGGGASGSSPIEKSLLEETAITVRVNDSYYLRANGTDLVWSSENEEIARVDTRGKVTGISMGETVIQVQSGEETAQCTVTVLEGVTLVAYSLNLSETNVALQVEEEMTLTCKVLENGEETAYVPTWASSDPTVVSVDNGKIEALSEGQAEITVKYDKVEAKCVVNVYEGEYGLFFGQSEYELDNGTTNYTLPVSLYKDGAAVNASAIEWSVVGNSVSVVNGKLNTIRRGTSIVTAQYASASATCVVKVYDEVGISTVEQFLAIEDDANIRYVLQNDIDFANYTWTKQNLIDSFSSVLDGNGYKLDNLNRARGTKDNYCGIFYQVEKGAEIRNLQVIIDSFYFNDCCGLFVVHNYGYIHDSYVYMKPSYVTNDNNTLLRSGLIQQNEKGAVVENLIVEIASGTKIQFQALAALNDGTITKCVVVSPQQGSYTVDTVSYYYRQMMSRATNRSYPPNPSGSANALWGNNFDPQRTNCLIYNSSAEMLSSTGLAYDGCGASLPEPDFTNSRISGRTYLAWFGSNWTFSTTSVTLCGRTVY